MEEFNKTHKVNKASRFNTIIFFVLFAHLGTIVNAQNIVFEKQLAEDNPLLNVDLGTGISNIPVDIDNDGNFDLFVGTNEGKVIYYKNISTPENPDVFEEQTGNLNPLNQINFEKKVTPSFVDIDGDGDIDVFIGTINSIAFYENIGTPEAPLFENKIGDSNPLSEVYSSGSRSYFPVFVDVDKDSDYDVFIGWVDFNVENSQGILFYSNTGSLAISQFENKEGQSNPFQAFNALYPNPVFVDADGDGDQDAFIGRGDGVLDYYKNTTDFSLRVDNNLSLRFSIYPNPAKGIVYFQGLENDIDIFVYDLFGKKVLQKNTTTKDYSLDVSLLKPGIYLISVNYEGKKVSKRLVISN